MVQQHEIELSGCTPEPLLNYLKALGVIRILSEQKSPEITCYWWHDRFRLVCPLTQQQLCSFFLRDYRPTPIICPWAGGSGFFLKDNKATLQSIRRSSAQRLEEFRQAIELADAILRQLGIQAPPKEEDKEKLFQVFRQRLPESFVQWLDAVAVLTDEGVKYAPVLGTGGNDGRLNFSQAFMQRLHVLGLTAAQPSAGAEILLSQSLFGHPTKGLKKLAVGQFAPGRAGGPNATQGMEGEALDNPWDFVLGMEGALVLAGAAVRRLNVAASARAAFPFTVDSRPLGEDSTPDASTRGELWLPIWEHPTTYGELRILFGEGRAEWGRRIARDTLDFARAIASLGVDRGIRSFVRFRFVQRAGRSYLATPVHRFVVPQQPHRAVELLRELDSWMASLHKDAASQNSPNLQVVYHRLENAIFNYCRHGQQNQVEQILIAVGHAEHALASLAARVRQQNDRRPVQTWPVGPLSSRWVEEVNDNSPEFRIALAIASIHGRPQQEDQQNGASFGPVRTNLEPVKWGKSGWQWSESDANVAWGPGSLASNLAAILERRLISAVQASVVDLPLASPRPARLSDVARWLWDDSGDERIANLIPGLALVRPASTEDSPQASLEEHDADVPIPRVYALLKLLFLPRPLVPPSGESQQWKLAWESNEGIRIRPELRILALLRAGRVSEACQIACRRLRASGLVPMPGPQSSGHVRDQVWWETETSSIHPQRLLAALLIPVNAYAVDRLARLVLRPGCLTVTASTSTPVE